MIICGVLIPSYYLKICYRQPSSKYCW